MANHKSAKKRIRRNANRAEINKSRISRIRTFVKRVETAIASGDKDAAQTALKEAQPELMRGVSKGVMHKNTASRKMSRLSAQVKDCWGIIVALPEQIHKGRQGAHLCTFFVCYFDILLKVLLCQFIS